MISDLEAGGGTMGPEGDLSDPSPTLGGYGASIDREVAIFGNADKRQAQSGGSGIRWL